MSEKQLEKQPEKSTELETPDSKKDESAPTKTEEIVKVVARVIASEFSGPIPPPNIIEGYEKVLPGSADRILKMAEEQSEHRQEMEKIAVNAESRDSLLGIVCALILALACLITAAIIVFMVPTAAGATFAAVLGAGGIGSIIGVFLTNTRRNRKSDSGK